MAKEMNYEDATQWMKERKLTPKEEEESAAAMKRFEELGNKKRLAKVVNIVETPEVVLDKVCSGIAEIQRLPAEAEFVDSSMSVQAQRFRDLATWFQNRMGVVDTPGQEEISKELDGISIDIEKFRMEFLTTGKKTQMSEFIERAKAVRGKIVELWGREDAGSGQ